MKENNVFPFLRRLGNMADWHKTIMILLLCAFSLSSVQLVTAQNVTIRGNNGSTIAAVKNGGTGDTFFAIGGFATWQHEQLSMVLTVSDGTALTPTGQLDNPANNMFVSSDSTKLQIAKGKAGDATVCYATLSLPKGYRFTGYNIKFSKPLNIEKYTIDNKNISIDGNQVNHVTINDNNETSTFGETNSTFSTFTTQASITSGGNAQTISRTETETNHMSNVLYFKLQGPTNKRSLIQIESAEIFFTSEENYSPVTPAGEISTPVSAVDIPFSTSKVDYGEVKERTYRIGGRDYKRISYASESVGDLYSNLLLYEAESVKAGTHYDGTTGNVVDYKAGSISSDGGYFRLGKTGVEQVYYLETPTYVELSDANKTKNPVGYRIIGAEIEYNTKAGANRTFYITYTDEGWLSSTTYYLNTEGRFTRTRVIWEIDSEGYISSNGNYLYFDNGYAATQRSKPSESERFGIDSSNNIYQLQWPTYFITFYEQGWINTTRYGLISNSSGDKATCEEISASQDPVDNYKLYVYDKTGANPKEISVSGHGTYKLSGLNNDAIKFGVKGIGLVRATMTLQALDPYLARMDVVCTDKDVPAIRLTENFTASDFSVSGGEFYFHVPVDTKNVAVTFENLHSKYFDETYDGGSTTHTSRINFVQSQHNQAFGTTTNNIYDNRDEAKSATLESTRIDNNSMVRTKVGVVGTQAFKFNNADEVGEDGGTLTEYPFTFAKYAAAPNNGSFDVMEYEVSDQDSVQTRYVFTTDETRYNIAPTTAIQHRAYAYYQMIVHVQSATYTPKVKFTKIYDSTFYTDDKGTIKYDPMYGVEVTASYTENGVEKQGYASTSDIYEAIDSILTKSHKDDFNNAVPNGTTSKQIIYLDFSKLKGVYQITNDTHQSMDDYSATNAKNCLIFLPVGASAPNDNVASKLESGGFHAANNIVITDKQPFFSPYDIQVDAANWVQYDRAITPAEGYTNVVNASVILPFTIDLDDSGSFQSKDKDGNNVGNAFKLASMNSGKALSNKNNYDNETDGYFTNIKGTSKANTPYIVTVEGKQNDDYNFYVRVKGSTIAATQSSQNGIFTGTVSSGTVDGTTYTLTPTGTYMGKEIKNAKAASPAIFYFSKDCFVTSRTLGAGKSLKILPFRSYYEYPAPAGAKMTKFHIVFGENDEDENVTGINEVQKNSDLGVIPGKGCITLMSKADNDVTIYAINGMTVEKCSLRAGDTHTVNVPAGVYVVNGVKMIVK